MLASWSLHSHGKRQTKTKSKTQKTKMPDRNGVVQRKTKWMRGTGGATEGGEDLIEKATLDKSPEGGRCKEMSPVKIWGKAFQAEEATSAKALRQTVLVCSRERHRS